MKKTWKPTVAGILSIVAGAGSLIGLLAVIVAILFVAGGTPFLSQYTDYGPLTAGILQMVLVIAAIYLAVTGVLPLLGGIYAIQRRKWGWALAGSIAAIFNSTLFGILATVFTALSREEFE